MSDLLVSSLMADGGLETALLDTLRAEDRDLEEKRENGEGFGDKAEDEHSRRLPLMTDLALLEAETKRAQEAVEASCSATGGY